jgi:thiol-disulfide isomerase/thioredoxin
VFAAMKRSLGAGEWVRRGLGLAVLAAVVAIAMGVDTGLLTRVSTASTASLEQGLLDHFKPEPSGADAGTTPSVVVNGGPSMMMGGAAMMMKAKPADGSDDLPIEGALPPLAGATEWLNSPPLTPEGLRGKVVLIDFWTYSCINCLRAIPYVRAWADKYRDQGLVVIGVHAPDGAPPGDGRGTDVDADGQGVVTGQRLYQLIRQTSKVSDHTFEIQFLDPGVQAYAFTFG